MSQEQALRKASMAAALPSFIRRPIEEAIEAAVNPKGMSVHDGKIHGLASDKVAYLLRAYDDLRQALQDPVRVHVAMLRGEIAKPAIQDMLHVYGAEALARWDAAAPQPESTQQPELMGWLFE
jgi:hypothetical protein